MKLLGSCECCVISFYIFFAFYYLLWYCGILCYIFIRVERALIFYNVFFHVERALVLWNFLSFFLRVELVLVLCYIFLRVECTLVLWNFVTYFSACGTRSGIV